MNYELIEEQIRERLATVMGHGYTVVALPEVEEDLKRLIDKPKVTVSYKGSDFGTMGRSDQAEVVSLGAVIVHKEVLTFDIVMQAKKLRGEYGLYGMIPMAQNALMGFMPDDCEKMYILKFGYVTFEQGIWTYCLKMATTSIRVEDAEYSNAPPIEKITIDSDNGQSITE